MQARDFPGKSLVRGREGENERTKGFRKCWHLLRSRRPAVFPVVDAWGGRFPGPDSPPPLLKAAVDYGTLLPESPALFHGSAGPLPEKVRRGRRTIPC